ncbi:unnamed protein product [Somion occarium]|uniref:Meiotically up-regulated protein Msb1/Mug8 domain-containing protein n=1 Tax=Somion occarium TaxID=3059160 RepID=A0ABP1CU87_9APHY
MPSFLSKVFGRKKDEHASSKRHSATSLLEGKFEAVSPNVSPSATHFTDSLPRVNQKEKEKDKDTAFSLFRPKSRQPPAPSLDTARPSSPSPILTLNLSEPKEDKRRTLGVVFEADPDNQRVLPESVIGERRLNSAETLSLVKACSAAIVSRGGLESLGVMHPHWYSASPDVQRKLISLFILSLAPQSQAPTLPVSPSSSSLLFESELSYTRSPHDIAAILRWALRHLQLDGNSFGTSSSAEPGSEEAWRWYTAFAEAERALSYPSNAFSQSLTPELPTAHHRLLTATLDIISSLAAHAETNGSSGSKLSKFLGLWLLTAQRSQESDDWNAFYARWERAGRILEHIYLSYIRDEASHEKMPLRLVELVKHYPYGKTSSEDALLPRPRFSTRQYDTLFVRVEAQLPDKRSTKPKLHPVQLVQEALKAEVDSNAGEHVQLWERIRQVSPEEEDTSAAFQLSRIFDEDTLNLLSLIPLEGTSPTISITIPPSNVRPVRRRSTSLGGPTAANGNRKGPSNGESAGTNGSLTASPTIPSSPTDWADFSSAGFGDITLGKDFAATLLDTDVEKTSPPDVSSQGGKKRRATSPTIPVSANRRSSADNPQAIANRIAAQMDAAKETLEVKRKASAVKMIQIDEAFIDFWSDAFTDPIAASWPAFVVCQLKPSLGLSVDGKAVNWLVIEHVFTYPAPPPSPVSPSSPVKRAASPKPSLRSNISTRKSGTFNAARKRFTFFSGSESAKGSNVKASGLTSPGLGGRKRGGKSPRIGEMGEILPDVEEGSSEPTSAQPTSSPSGLGLLDDAPAVPAKAETPRAELSPVPVVDAPPAAETVPVATEPVNVDEDRTKLTAIHPPQPTPTSHVSNGPSDVAEAAAATVPVPEKTLPSAPELVVQTGATLGPEVALSSGGPVVQAEATTTAASEINQGLVERVVAPEEPTEPAPGFQQSEAKVDEDVDETPLASPATTKVFEGIPSQDNVSSPGEETVVQTGGLGKPLPTEKAAEDLTEPDVITEDKPAVSEPFFEPSTTNASLQPVGTVEAPNQHPVSNEKEPLAQTEVISQIPKSATEDTEEIPEQTKTRSHTADAETKKGEGLQGDSPDVSVYSKGAEGGTLAQDAVPGFAAPSQTTSQETDGGEDKSTLPDHIQGNGSSQPSESGVVPVEHALQEHDVVGGKPTPTVSEEETPSAGETPSTTQS